MQKLYAVYVCSNQSDSVFYIGVTGNLKRRIYQHRTGSIDGFTRLYKVKKLVYYEVHEDVRTAIEREKKLKGGSRARKLELVRSINPDFRDLYFDL